MGDVAIPPGQNLRPAWDLRWTGTLLVYRSSVRSSTDHQLLVAQRGCFTSSSSSSDFFKQLQMRFPATTSHFFASGSRARAARSRCPCLLCHVSRCLSLGNSQILLLSPFQGNLNAQSRQNQSCFARRFEPLGGGLRACYPVVWCFFLLARTFSFGKVKLVRASIVAMRCTAFILPQL